MDRIEVGDCGQILGKWACDGIQVHTCVTSPPYFGLRDYGVPGQLGFGETLESYIQALVFVFRRVRRVLREDGTVWLNMGDSYSSGNRKSYDSDTKSNGIQKSQELPKMPSGIKIKDLIGVPWRVAFALQEDGWYLRNDIIWAKNNPMPESVRDRCTRAHEYIFLFTKSQKYYFDVDAIREPFTSQAEHEKRKRIVSSHGDSEKSTKNMKGGHNMLGDPSKGRNKRSVWSVNTKPYRGAHFATFPEALIEPCVLAGCPEGGTVLDPFMGSGTTGIACGNNEKRFIGIEKEEEYFRLARIRIMESLDE